MPQARHPAVSSGCRRAAARPLAIVLHRRSAARHLARTRLRRDRHPRTLDRFVTGGSLRGAGEVPRLSFAGRSGQSGHRIDGMNKPARIAVLASGGGSNLQALLDYLATRPESRAEVALVASDRPDAGALDRGRKAGIPAVILRSKNQPDGADLMETLAAHRADFVALAGYLRLLPKEALAEFPNRVVNVHPALLPEFGGPGMYGERVHRAVLAAGARVSGATVHYVDEEYDRGAILAQWPVPVLADDTIQSLANRVLKVEHVLYPRVIDAVASGKWRHNARPNAVPEAAAFALMHWDERRLAQDIEGAFGL